MIADAQLRAARAMLGMTAEDLSILAGIGLATIKRFELSQGIPPSRGGTLNRVRAALEAAGIEFIGDPELSPGVRLNHR